MTQATDELCCCRHCHTPNKQLTGLCKHVSQLFTTEAAAASADPTVTWWCRLDYPGIGPEHSYLSEIGRAEYYAVTDDEALEAFQQVSRLEGIIPALETSHAFAYLKVCRPSQLSMVNLTLQSSLPGELTLTHVTICQCPGVVVLILHGSRPTFACFLTCVFKEVTTSRVVPAH